MHLLIIIRFMTPLSEYVLESPEIIHIVDAGVEHLVLLPGPPLLHLLLCELYALHVLLL